MSKHPEAWIWVHLWLKSSSEGLSGEGAKAEVELKLTAAARPVWGWWAGTPVDQNILTEVNGILFVVLKVIKTWHLKKKKKFNSKVPDTPIHRPHSGQGLLLWWEVVPVWIFTWGKKSKVTAWLKTARKRETICVKNKICGQTLQINYVENL